MSKFAKSATPGLRQNAERKKTHDKGLVMFLQLAETAICRVKGHVGRQTPLVDSGPSREVHVRLEESGNDERFGHEPATEVNTARR